MYDVAKQVNGIFPLPPLELKVRDVTFHFLVHPVNVNGEIDVD